MKKPEANFDEFLEKFPELELPVTLNEETHHTFSRKNTPFKEIEVKKFIKPYEQLEDDGHTEYVPCFSIKVEHDFHAIIYWRARLLTYEYFISTYNKNGLGLSRKKIAGMVTHGDEISQAVATIEKDWIIYVVEGAAKASDSGSYDPKSTNSYSLELLADGQIIFTLNEDLYS